MAEVKLGQNAIDYAASALKGESGVASLISRENLQSPIIFAPEAAASSYENLDAGGVTTQFQANKELSVYLKELKKRDFSLCSILLQDPWIKLDDLRNLGPPPSEALTLGESVYYLYDIRSANPDLVETFRARCRSFLKLLYVSTMSIGAVREKMRDGEHDEIFRYAKSIRHVMISACDDETWLTCCL